MVWQQGRMLKKAGCTKRKNGRKRRSNRKEQYLASWKSVDGLRPTRPPSSPSNYEVSVYFHRHREANRKSVVEVWLRSNCHSLHVAYCFEPKSLQILQWNSHTTRPVILPAHNISFSGYSHACPIYSALFWVPCVQVTCLKCITLVYVRSSLPCINIGVRIATTSVLKVSFYISKHRAS